MTALTGLRVIELAHERVAFAGKLLADMGADVILVEPPGGALERHYPPFLNDEPGPDRSLWWWHYHTNKQGVVIDLESTAGRAQLLGLIDHADVLIESEPTQRLEALGLDWPALVVRRPGLIHAALTPFGRRNPDSDLPATDLTLMAGGGPVWSCGYDDHSLPPVRGLGEHASNTGCHYAVMAILTAVLARITTGRGQFIDVSLHAALNVTTEGASYQWLVNGTTVQRQTGRHASIVPTGPTQVQCADGRFANTGVPPRVPAEFAALKDWLEALGLTDELPEAFFLEMGATWQGTFDLSLIGRDDTVTAVFSAGREALKLIARNVPAYDFFVGCQRAGLATGIIYAPEEAFEDPHFRARGFDVEVFHPELDRHIRYPGAPWRMPASPWRIARRAPALGEHQQELLGTGVHGAETP
ncbi:MAG: CaiB/BaiF CoA transferase family protein [Pseudomonadales bacterium]